MNLRRPIASSLIAVLAVLLLPSIAEASNPETVTLTVHYQRPAKDYAGWNMWLWKNVTSGSDVNVNNDGVQFTGDDAFGKVATVVIDGMDKFENVGIILRKGAWTEKDISTDRFITKFDSNGKSEIWLRQDDSVIHYELPTGEIAVAPEVLRAKMYDSADFATKYTYAGNDLGNTYSTSSTKFRVWAPTATAVKLVTYPNATSVYADGVETPMTADVNGTWVAALSGDKDGLIYNYRVTVDGETKEAVDPYVRATTIDGVRGVVVNLDKTDPSNWKKAKPAFSGKTTDAVIYEIHVRDLSMDFSSGVSEANKGKYLAFTETKNNYKGGKTGVAAIKDLGVTHVELLPVFDYASVTEGSPTFNWGYDPQNYNVPEGSYSSDPTKPTARITELKSAIQSLHNQKLRVNMDVVYNHVYNASNFSQNIIVPGYFFRTDAFGGLTSASGCGNDVATERPMVRKFIVDSVKYWAQEYNFDGFRFDLMGLMDIQTTNEVAAALKAIDPTIIIIGEGWNMGTLPSSQRASQVNADQLGNVAMFNDQLRDGIKGSVFTASDTGWATGKAVAAKDVRTGITGNIDYPGTVLAKWTSAAPGQSVNYVESHDNLTLVDKITLSVKDVSPALTAQYSQFAASIAFLAQGTPFMQAGQEFLRSKNGDENSYKSSDLINQIKWSTRSEYATTVKYYQGLLALRASHPAFRFTTTSQVNTNLKFLTSPEGTIEYSLNGKAVKDKASSIVVIHNSNTSATTITLPNSKQWDVVVKGSIAGTKTLQKITGNKVVVPAQSTLVVTQK
jgi:pullulanase